MAELLRHGITPREKLMTPISAQQLDQWLHDDSAAQPLLLDVREAWELNICRIDGSRHIPMQEIPARLQEIDDDVDIVCICHHGMRSAQVAMFLERQGHARLFNLSGGVAAWAATVDPQMPQY